MFHTKRTGERREERGERKEEIVESREERDKRKFFEQTTTPFDEKA